MKKATLRTICSSLTVSILVPLGAVAAQSDSGGTHLEKCDKPYGTIAVHEPKNDIMAQLQRYKLGSPTQLLRKMIQDSNCFQVVERGVAMADMQQERELGRSGQLQGGSDVGDGQMRAADYVLTPTVQFSEGNAGGFGGIIGGLSPFGALGAGLKFKEAQTSITIADIRSSIQVASAEGKATKKDFSIGLLGWGGGGLLGLGGYTNTNEGKVVAASFLDNLNNVVTSVKKNPDMKPMLAGAAGGAGNNVKAGAVFNEGDVLRSKLENQKLLAQPSEGAKISGTVGKADDMIYLGEEKDGYVHVQASAGEGWIKKIFVQKGGRSDDLSSASRGPSSSGLASAFIGDWQGLMYMNGGRASQAIRISLSRSFGVSADPSSGCTTNMAFVEGTESHFFYRVSGSTGRCLNTGILEFTPGPGGTLDVKLHVPLPIETGLDGAVIATATLSKAS